MSFSDEVTRNNNSKFHKETNIKNIEFLKKKIKKLNYEESIAALEVILINVQDENISLDQIKNNYINLEVFL